MAGQSAESGAAAAGTAQNGRRRAGSPAAAAVTAADRTADVPIASVTYGSRPADFSRRHQIVRGRAV